MAIVVREVSNDDVDALIPIWQEIQADSPSPSVTPLTTRIEQSLNSENFRVLTAWDNENVVGIALIGIADVGVWTEQSCLKISGLHVLKTSRHRGVAKAILNTALAYADKWGCRDIMASVPPQEREANRFFARLGFAPIATRRIAETAFLRKKISDEPARMVAQRIRRKSQSLLGGHLR